MLKVIWGLILPVIIGIILFAISPIWGILWTIWMTLVVIYALRKDLLIRFIEWVFRIRR